MVNSINKGKNWERKFAKMLTKATGVKWHRTASSGAMATAQGIKDSKYKGDLFCEDDKYKDIVVEVKAYKNNIRLEDIFNPKSVFWKWVRQCENESDDNFWILLFHTNNGMSFLLFDEEKMLDNEEVSELVIKIVENKIGVAIRKKEIDNVGISEPIKHYNIYKLKG